MVSLEEQQLQAALMMSTMSEEEMIERAIQLRLPSHRKRETKETYQYQLKLY